VKLNHEQQSSEHQLGLAGANTVVASAKQQGELGMATFVCGFIGALLTITLSILGWYKELDAGLRSLYQAEPFYLQDVSGWSRVWDWILVAVLGFAVAYAVLDTDRPWKRVMMLLMASVLVVFTSPVLVLWDVFWSPVTVFVGLIWSWLCAFIYSIQHVMPCQIRLKTEFDSQLVSPKLFLGKSEEVENDVETSPTQSYQPK